MNPITLKELIDHHRTEALRARGSAVGWGRPNPGTLTERQKYRFHSDAEEFLKRLEKAEWLARPVGGWK